MKSLSRGFVFALLLAITAAAGAAKDPPPDPRFMNIESVSVLPIVDARAGKKAGVNLQNLQNSVVNILRKKRYLVNSSPNDGDAGQIAEEDLQAGEPQFIRKLGPADSRWVLVVCLEDVISKVTFGSTGNAEMSGYLFDKESGKVIWQSKGVGQAGQGGLLGMTMKGMMSGEAIGSALSNLFAGLPAKPKPGK